MNLPIPQRLRANPWALGALLSLASVAAAGAVAGLLALAAGEPGPSAGASLLGMREPWLFLLAVLVLPALETATGQLLPIEALRWLRAPAAVCVAGSAALFGLGHALGGGPGHGLTTLASGLVFAAAYMAFRHESAGRGAACAWACHAAHNALFLYAVAPLAGLLAAAAPGAGAAP